MDGEAITPNHPLDPYSGEELTRAAEILRESGEISDASRFSCALPIEPAKELVKTFEPGSPFERQVRLIGHDRERGSSFDARVSLSKSKLEEFSWVESGQASVSGSDAMRAFHLIHASPDWQAALRKRGIEDSSLVQIDPWVTGVRPEGMAPNARVLAGVSFLHEDPEDNAYARPIEGVIAYVDVDSGQVIVVDRGVVPFPPEAGDYDAESVGPLRQDLRPIEITQPEGPSFEVDGHAIRWQKWRFRISLHPLEGVVLHDVRYDDDGRARPILYRASLSDMIVPYGDSSPMHSWKHAFDASEATLGQNVNSLSLGCDCVGEIRYFDATFLSPKGKAHTIENAVCMHEEDFGILWKHTNVFMPSTTPEVRRSRRLVVSAIHTLGNYEYGFYWYFYLDGTIQMEVKLTGIVGVSAVGDGKGTDTAPLIAPSLASPIHQHLFCFRLDFDLEGERNSVYEVDVEPLSADEDPHGSGFRSVARLLRSEKEAQREVDPSRSRHWRVVNPDVRNRLGAPVGYKLLPQGTPTLLAKGDSLHARRAGFARHNLWVTPYAPDELDAAAGAFTNLHPGGAGLPAYTANDRPLENTDVVVWHTVGVTHVPRPEDWPVMPVEYCGFTLLPFGFFERNPALDVPPSHSKGHCSS